MAKENRHALRAEVRENYLQEVSRMIYQGLGDEVLRTKSNQICIPVVDRRGNEDFLTITFAIPTGERGGDPYDGYSHAEEYQIKLASKSKKENK